MAAIADRDSADRPQPLAVRPSSRGAAELYERHSGRVFGYCLSRLGGREDAEDATQLTFLHALTGLRRGIVPTTESAWLLGIARNVCLARWASASRRNRFESACDPLELQGLAPARDSRQDELIGLEHALEGLPEQQRRAVLLRDWRGLSYEEVAEQLGVSHAAVETLIFRGRDALADQLRDQPSHGRRRLRSLGELGSLLNAIKGLFAGATAGAKLAVCAAAVVAVSGGGVALEAARTGTPAPDHAPPGPPQTLPRPAATRPALLAAEEPVAHTSASAGATAAPAATPTLLAAAETPVGPSARAPEAPGAAADAVPAPTAGHEPGGAAQTPPVEASRVETPSVEASRVEAPRVEAPSAAEPPPTGPVGALPLDVPPAPSPTVEAPSLAAVQPQAIDPVVAALAPVSAVVNETLASAPPLPGPDPVLPLPPVPEPPAVRLPLP